MTEASFHFETQDTKTSLFLSGNWHLGKTPEGVALSGSIPPATTEIHLITTDLGQWDSSLAISMLQLARWCDAKKIRFVTAAAPQGLQHLIRLATDVPAYQQSSEKKTTPVGESLIKGFDSQWHEVRTTLSFVGDTSLALMRWLCGKAKTRRSDIFYFIEQAGPRALAIVTLISLLVGRFWPT